MKEFLKKLFCGHRNNEVVCWHWTHGPYGNDPLQLEIQLRCTECGKYHFMHIDDPSRYDDFTSKYTDKEWSDTRRPVL